jgi:hypothetical protein
MIERRGNPRPRLLVQLGLLDPAGLPVVGVEGTRSVLDRSIPLNGLIHRAYHDEGYFDTLSGWWDARQHMVHGDGVGKS